MIFNSLPSHSREITLTPLPDRHLVPRNLNDFILFINEIE